MKWSEIIFVAFWTMLTFSVGFFAGMHWRTIYANRTHNYNQIANLFNVTEGNVWHIVTNKTWKHLLPSCPMRSDNQTYVNRVLKGEK